MNILITSMGTATSVGLLKGIRKSEYNIKIIGTDTNSFGDIAGSMLVDVFYQVPYAVDESYICSLMEILKKEKVDILIPINDIEIKTIMGHKYLFTKYTIMAPDIDTICQIEDKYICSTYMAEHGIRIPPVMLEDDQTMKRIVRDRIGVGSKGIRIVEIGESCGRIREDQFIQQFTLGEEYTVDVLSDWEGRPLYVIPRKRMEVKSGVATKVKIEQDNELIQIAVKIMGFYKVPGFSNIQFIKNSQGCYDFIEINPRIGGCSIASLVSAKGMITTFLKLVQDKSYHAEGFEKNNEEVKWNAVITRYYEELVYWNGDCQKV